MASRQNDKNDGVAELSLAVAATNIIRDRILDLTLQPGAQLDETLLRTELGISRTPAREALNRLTNEGLIETRPNRGFFVRALDLGNLTQFFEAYAVSERSSAYYCRMKHPNLVRDLQTIQSNHARAIRKQLFMEITLYNAAFHIRIAEATKNEHLFSFAGRLHNLARRIAYYVYLQESDEQQSFHKRQDMIVDEHNVIIDAIRDGDRDKLLATITDHADSFRRRISRFVEGADRPIFKFA